MCRNPACRNFGLPYEGRSLGHKKTVADDRYRIEAKRGRITCKRCGQSFALKSNRAIGPLARYFLKLSLPFADCPNRTCSNYGYNFFERYHESPGRRRVGRYRKLDRHRAACRHCGTRFRFGEALHLERTRAMRVAVREIIRGVRAKRSVSDTIDQTEMPVSSYYSRLGRVSARLRDWHSWRNAKLLHEKFGKWQEPLRAYTDIIEVSLQRAGEGARHTRLGIIVTVIAIEKSYFVLAAHPGFLPEAHGPDLATMLNEMHKPPFLAEWDCLRHGFGSRPSDDVATMMTSLPDLGRGGYFSAAYYAELAHFLVVGKLLARFPRVYHYMDGSRSLFSSALTAFAGDIRSGRVEVALFQHDKHYQQRSAQGSVIPAVSRARWSKWKKEQLHTAWQEMQAGFAERMGSGSLDWQGGATVSDEPARVFKSAFKGGYSKTGGWAWLRFPPTTRHYKDPRTLWLTWAPHKGLEEHGRELLLNSTLQPVDSAFNVLRLRARGIKRGVFRAAQGRGYLEAYVDPEVVLAELWIVLLWRNYGVRHKTRNKIPPARLLQLMTPKESVPDLVRLAWEFQLGVEHARRITQWVIR